MLEIVKNSLAGYKPSGGINTALLAVSGGADSIAMLHLLHRHWSPNGVTLVVAHVNHGLRGDAADADTIFVQEVAASLGLRCLVARVAAREVMAESSESLEMVARDLRWQELRRISDEVGADVICTGHTADDQIETLFLRLARGAGARGVGGIAFCSRHAGLPPVLRPLLDVRRVQIMDWLRREGLAWREDASNSDLSIPRNRVRHELVPVFEKVLGSAAMPNTLRSMALLRDEHDNWLDPIVAELLGTSTGRGEEQGILFLKNLTDHPRPLVRRVLLAWLQNQEFSAALQTRLLLENLTDFALSEDSGTRYLTLGDGLAVLREYDTMRITAEEIAGEAVLPEVELLLPGRVESAEWGLAAQVEVGQGIERPARTRPDNLPQSATICVQAVGSEGLTLRSIRPGDRMKPFGSSGTKKISDILIDCKIPRAVRKTIPLIVSGDRVVWLPGIAVSEPFAVPDEQAASYRITLRGKTGRAGATLVEALVALALVGIMFLPALLAMQTLLQGEERLERRLHCELAGRGELESLSMRAAVWPEKMREVAVRHLPERSLRMISRYRPQEKETPAAVSVTVNSVDAPDEPARVFKRDLLLRSAVAEEADPGRGKM